MTTTTPHDDAASGPSLSSPSSPPLPSSLLASQEALRLLRFALDMYSRHQDGIMMLMCGEEEELKLMCYHLGCVYKKCWGVLLRSRWQQGMEGNTRRHQEGRKRTR